MSNAKSSKHDENANTHVVGSHGHDELSNYAQDALKEVLGWYGLQEGGSEGGPGPNPAALHRPDARVLPQVPTSQTSSDTPHNSSKSVRTSSEESANTSTHRAAPDKEQCPPAAKMVVKPDYEAVENSTFAPQRPPVSTVGERPRARDDPLDLTNGHGPLAEMANNDGSSGKSSSSWAGHRKLIGMRFLFPPLSDDMSLLERAQIWVRRHDNKYFVGWSAEQLQAVDPVLRPIGTITSDKYKLHMNRSEYCRNVKLKYCLESDCDWAQEFRDKLRKPASGGGFTGLCQVKIAAAELWRQYSENYRSHQARYPNPKSKHRSHHSGGDGGNDSDTSSKRKSSADDSIDLEDEGTDESQEAKRVRLEDEYDLMCDDEEIDPGKMSCESDEGHEGSEDGGYHGNPGHEGPEQEVHVETREKVARVSPLQSEERSKQMFYHKGGSPQREKPTILAEFPGTSKPDEPHTPSESSTSGLSPMILTPDQIAGRSFFPPFPGAPTYLGMPMPLYPPPASPFALGLRGDSHFHLESPVHLKLNPTGAEAITSSVMNFAKPKLSERHHHEYKRSERGLSYLFPSLSDHNLSLMDKVKITVIRHKNNYFLGKSEADLNKIDPLIRPKMVVTMDIYKEYCHRNAMKYDSNLQFAMESPESWAQEFRAKLMRPPSEGGFSSLCEVKLEAGRLWREYSGKYRMHNIVKWQMDLNNASKIPKQETDTSDRQRQASSPISPLEHVESDLRAAKMLSPQTSTESLDPYSAMHQSRASGSMDPEQVKRSSEVFASSPKTLLAESSMRIPSGGVGGPSDHHAEAHLRLGSDSSSGSSTSKKLRGHITSKSQQPELSSHPLAKPVSGTMGEVPELMSRVPISAQDSARPRFSEQLPDVLFKPLPRSLNVAEQLSVWLERHRYNYFLGFPREDLLHLNELLCPSMPVTEETFKKYIPESMVDILSKIELILLSSEPWALEFQDKIHKSAKEGGFSTFEDALTEAVVLWNIARTSYHHQQMMREARPRATARPDQLDITGQAPVSVQTLSSPGQPPVKLETVESPRHGSFRGMSPASIFRYQMENQHAYMSRVQAQSARRSLDRPPAESPSPRHTQSHVGPVEEQGLAPLRQPEHREEAAAGKELKTRPAKVEEAPANPEFLAQRSLNIMWALRDELQALCRDKPALSWQEQLEPHLATLKANVGASYLLPSTNSGCALDLVLATIHEHMQHITVLLASQQGRPEGGDVTPATTS